MVTVIAAVILLFLSIIFHEAAHAMMSEVLGLRVKRVSINWTGIGIWREAGKPWQNALVAAAGPVATFLLAWLLWSLLPSVAWGNLGFGMLSIFWPSREADGFKIMRGLTTKG